jgi:preprotein translocase subunit YajC
MTAPVLLQISGISPQITQYIMFGLIFLVFYFFMIRPQIKKQKDQKKYVEELKKGDKVVTTAGIHGKIVDLSDAFVVIDVDKGVNIKFDKSAISLEASKALNAATKA